MKKSVCINQYKEKLCALQIVGNPLFNSLLSLDLVRSVRGFEGYYVSFWGDVLSTRQKQVRVIKSITNNNGYLFVLLRCNGRKKKMYIHRLVAQAFIPNPDNLPQINHIDETRINNKVENLEWCTAKHNVNYGRRSILFAAKVAKSVFRVENNTVVALYYSIKATEKDGYNARLVSACAIGKNKSHKGCQWVFVSEVFKTDVKICVDDRDYLVCI